MTVTLSFREYLVDQLAGFGELTVKRMFGGLGLYSEGRFFAVVDDDTLFFRVDDATRPDFVARGMPAFRPTADKVSENYYQCPGDVLEDADEVQQWAKRAVRAAASPTAAKAKRATAARSKPAKRKAKKR